jgi:hypothetical protein
MKLYNNMQALLWMCKKKVPQKMQISPDMEEQKVYTHLFTTTIESKFTHSHHHHHHHHHHNNSLYGINLVFVLARTSLRAFDVPIPNASRHSRSITAILQHKLNLLHLGPPASLFNVCHVLSAISDQGWRVSHLVSKQSPTFLNILQIFFFCS